MPQIFLLMQLQQNLFLFFYGLTLTLTITEIPQIQTENFGVTFYLRNGPYENCGFFRGSGK